jgi:mono/diheme cytochrome c family protein
MSVALVVALGVGSMMMSAANDAAAEEIQSSIARGGRLYDNWYKEIRKPAPEPTHSAYPAAGKKKGPDTWRCKECHGWDYRGADGAYSAGAHFSGIIGIKGMAGADPQEITGVLQNSTHGLTELDLLDDRDFRDLANFVGKGQIDMDVYIDRISGKAKGDPTRRRAYYQTICANCHGRDGLKIRTIPPLGQVATENPWEALHNMLNGHPDVEMPPLRVLDDTQALVDVLAYMQTFPTEEVLWSIVRGGRLYDNWYKEFGRPEPTRPHPAYPPEGTYAKSAKASWRCKECHGWDYKGRDGAYATGPHYTGIKGIQGMAGAEPRKIIAVLNNATHRYRGALEYRPLMDDYDIQDLANFVSMGQVDMDDFIDRHTKKAKGDPARREYFYATICANCHGVDGMKVSTTRPLGDVARGNPWEALHNILNGHAGVAMPPLRVLDDPWTIVDILAYIQTLPTR